MSNEAWNSRRSIRMMSVMMITGAKIRHQIVDISQTIFFDDKHNAWHIYTSKVDKVSSLVKKKNDNTYFPEEGTANAEIKIRSSENSVLPKVLYVKPRLNHYIAMRASPVARNFFLFNSYVPSPFNFIFSKKKKKLSLVFPCVRRG